MLRLKELRKKMDLKQSDIAEKLGVTQSAYSGWETGKVEMDYDTLAFLADFFDVSADYILGISDKDINEFIEQCKIPVVHSLNILLSEENIGEVVDFEMLPPHLAKTGEYFGIRIKGDSMAPRILHGDMLIVHTQNNYKSGDIAVISIRDEIAKVRKIQMDKHGIILVPINPNYKTVYFSNDDIIENKVKIIGKVIECRAKL